MKRFVVGVDGSRAAGQALKWAGDVARRMDAEVVAVHGFKFPFAEVSPDLGDQLLAERRALLENDWVKPLIDAGVSVRTDVRIEDPRGLVLAVAESEQADLIVLGRTGRGGGPGFIHLGSVVEHAAHHARHPLAVIPANSWEPVRRIVLGVDGSEESLAAVSWCADLAAAADATVVAVSVEDPFLEWTPPSSADNWRRDVERELDTWTAPLTAAGVTVERIAQRDLHPANGLLDVASAREADLLVIGMRGAGGFLGLSVGGVAMKVLHRATLPLVLVPTRS